MKRIFVNGQSITTQEELDKAVDEILASGATAAVFQGDVAGITVPHKQTIDCRDKNQSK
jgi:hypothetical protein